MQNTKISAAFVAAQKKFSPAIKNASNPHYKSRYADLSSVVDAVIDALNDHDIALLQHTHECADGVLIETVFLHSSGEQMTTGKLHIPASKLDAHGFGSALSYARRYSLMTACGLVASDDDDGNIAVANLNQEYLAYEKKYLPMMEDAAKQGLVALQSAFGGLTGPHKTAFWKNNSVQLKAIAGKTKNESSQDDIRK